MSSGKQPLFVPPGEHPARLAAEKLLEQCEVRRQRRSGPGGQHRNKVETAVMLKHRQTGVTAEASERRSQPDNLRVAVRRLRVALAFEVRSKLDEHSSPSPLWQSRCRNGRINVSTSHDDFPSILTEAIDAISYHDFELAAAAAWLGCTGSQLVKLLKSEPAALARVNDHREVRGLGRLK